MLMLNCVEIASLPKLSIQRPIEVIISHLAKVALLAENSLRVPLSKKVFNGTCTGQWKLDTTSSNIISNY